MDEDLQDLPIDIHIGKLVEWLVSRQHAAKDWAETSRSVREKINAAIQDMPEHPEIVKLLSGTYINYFHCLQIVEILRETEADSKNILGWYTSQRMKDWQSIIKMYEKGGAGLAECGQLLHQYVSYEIPGINNQITRCSQIHEECEKKEADLQKSSVDANNQFLKQCKQIGIKGEDVREEILGLLAELPNELDGIGKGFEPLSEAISFYRDFISFTTPRPSDKSLAALDYITRNGNVTMYQYKHKVAPTSANDPISALLASLKISSKKPQSTEVADTIDFGADEGIDFGGDEAIDFGDGGDSADIDFGDDITVEGGNGDQIDFGDWNVPEADIAAAKQSTAGISLEGEGEVVSGAAEGPDALTLLLDPNMRNNILDDLFELEAFLQQRIVEIGASEKSNVILNLWDEAPKSIQMVTEEQLFKYLAAVQKVIQSLTSQRMNKLFLICTSARYVDRLTENLLSQKAKSVINPADVEKIRKRRQESLTQEKKLNSQLKKIKAAAKSLCLQIQDSVSAKYNNRPVNIMGVLKNL